MLTERVAPALQSADSRPAVAGGLAGIGWAALTVAAFLLPGATPKASDSGSTIAAWFTRHRAALLAGDVLWGLAAVAFLLFLGTVATHIARSPRGMSFAIMASAGGATGIALLLATSAATNALAFRVAETTDGQLAHALFDLTTALFALAAFGFAAFFSAVACAAIGQRCFPAWLGWMLLVPIALDMLGGGAALVVEHGPLAAGGSIGLADGLVDAGAVVTIGVLLMRGAAARPRTEDRGRRSSERQGPVFGDALAGRSS